MVQPLFKIGTSTMPTPSELSVDIMDVSKAERNARGDMIIERITTKRKIAIKYNFLTREDMALVLNAVSPVFFDVTYIDPILNAVRTATFYVGDRSVGFLDFLNEVARYKDISFDLIEK
jgi:hypothetical protein